MRSPTTVTSDSAYEGFELRLESDLAPDVTATRALEFARVVFDKMIDIPAAESVHDRGYARLHELRRLGYNT